jgi:hypothetical protein
MIALLGSLLVWAFAITPVSAAAASPPVVYAPADSGPSVTAVPLGGGSSGRAPWKVTVSFRCDDQTVDGSLWVLDRGAGGLVRVQAS